MQVETLDNIFPFVVLGYGTITTAVLNSPLLDVAETRLPAKMTEQLKAHRTLALICLGVGFLWSLQSLWLTT